MNINPDGQKGTVHPVGIYFPIRTGGLYIIPLTQPLPSIHAVICLCLGYRPSYPAEWVKHEHITNNQLLASVPGPDLETTPVRVELGRRHTCSYCAILCAAMFNTQF